MEKMSFLCLMGLKEMAVAAATAMYILNYWIFT
jgi:hypothetical protein